MVPSGSSKDEEKGLHIGYDSGAAMMASGSAALHDHVAARIEAALGRSMPQMEVRYRDVTISAQDVVKDDSQTMSELPTIANTIKMVFVRISSKKHTVEHKILRGASGVLKPDTMTLVLGQPGSGKSSLMKVLSGRFPNDKHVHVDGEVSYNGKSQDELRQRLPQFVSYVDQHDKHFPTLTVKETLEFAHSCSGGGLSKRDEECFVHGSAEQNEAALVAARAMYKHHPGVIIRQLGLESCQDTIVGNVTLRGVSGGERKRVTTGEMAFGDKNVMFMDEISTGLDSAATFDIVSTQRSLARKFRKTVVISLLQPPPEVFELFDEVILLNDGYVVYHGPRQQALPYFENLGFKCPQNRDVADFLLDLGTNKQCQYEVRAVPVSASQFAESFKQSEDYKRLMEDLNAPLASHLIEDNKHHVDLLPEFHQSFWQGTITLIRRQMMVTLRNKALLKSRFLMAIFLGLLNASTFYQFDETDSQVVMGVLYVSINFVMLGQSAQVPTFMATREIFNKQRGANFYRSSSFVLATSVSQIPLALLEALIFGSIMYWMCGFVSTAAGYLLFELILFLTCMLFAAWFFFLAVVSPNMNVATPIANLSLLLFTLFSGFTITRGHVPGYLIWMYYVSPLAWGIRALALNQYTDSRFTVCVYRGVNYCESYGMTMSDYALTSYDVPTERAWLWLGIVYVVGVYLFFMVTAWLVLEYWRYESPQRHTLRSNGNAFGGETSSSTTDYGLAVTPKEANMAIPIVQTPERAFVPVTIAFRDLWYSVPDPAQPKATIDLLKSISGFALPGTMTALMGSSGAGKTTLMDVIAGRKTGGTIRGQILLNGQSASELAIRRCTGYCEQMDIHSDGSTFREALTFSAFLRQGSDVPDSTKSMTAWSCWACRRSRTRSFAAAPQSNSSD